MSKSHQSAPVAVIIPCYRCRATLNRALTSVLNQTLLPAEILLVDDASEDGTLHVMQQLEATHAPLVKVIALSKNGGPGLARNAGWDVATQPWIAFLDADDVWHPRKLELQWRWLTAHPDVALCGHESRHTEGRFDHPVDEASSETRLTVGGMLVSNRLPTRSVMLRRDLPFRFQGKSVTEDYLLWLQIIAAGLSAYRIEVCLAYSLRPDFSPGGYSGQLWLHEKRELAALKTLLTEGGIGRGAYFLAVGWSLLKYLRRVWLVRVGAKI